MRIAIIFSIVFLLSMGVVFGVERFPPPEFDSGYEFPEMTTPESNANLDDYIGVVILLVTLSLASYLALKRRSRRGIFILVIFSLFYFGFWRRGCICPVASTQNVALALFSHSYTVPITVIAFFTLPLIFTLFFGRTFCAAVCPFGVIQDVVVLRPIKVPSWLEHALGLLPYVYLGATVLFAATGSAFIICEYNPYLPFFRGTNSIYMIIFGAFFLLIGLFVARPYCRYLCPYSVMLNLISRVSRWHVTITPDECIQCQLCEDACPFGSIQKPTEERQTRNWSEGKKRLAVLIVLLPVFILSSGWLGVRLSTPLSRVNATVRLAERVWLEDTGNVQGTTLFSEAFYETGRPSREVYERAWNLKRQFVVGGAVFGGFIGLVIGIKLVYLSVRRRRTDYEINQGTCLSCARCFSYCPIGRAQSKKNIKGK